MLHYTIVNCTALHCNVYLRTAHGTPPWGNYLTWTGSLLTFLTVKHLPESNFRGKYQALYCTTQSKFLSSFAYGQQLAAHLIQPTHMIWTESQRVKESDGQRVWDCDCERVRESWHQSVTWSKSHRVKTKQWLGYPIIANPYNSIKNIGLQYSVVHLTTWHY